MTKAIEKNLCASSYATSKYNALEDHIEELESKNKEDK